MLECPSMKIREIKLGKGHPIVIQSMTNTDTADAQATAKQCMELADAGAEMVRITVNNEQAAKAVIEIRQILDKNDYSSLPLIGDFHYNGHELLSNHPDCAQTLDKYRINPDNVGDKNFETIIKIAIQNNKPIRIGVNAGSTDKDLVQTALDSAKAAEDLGLPQDQIVLSVKTSDVQETIKAYEQLANEPYALHLGLTEAGSGMQGIVSSTAALAILLQKGIGNTIRISLTPEPGKSRTEEVKACRALLQSLGLRNFRPKVTSCPGCGRTDSTFFQELASEINDYIDRKMPTWQREFKGVEDLKIAVMGCVVNGPGEARNADIAISLPGKNEQKTAILYIDGKLAKTLTGENILEQFTSQLEEYLQNSHKRV